MSLQVDIVFGWLGHAVIRVVHPERSVFLFEKSKSASNGCHAAAFPDATLDDVACDPVLANVFDRIAKGQNSFWRSHRERCDGFDDLSLCFS